MDLINGAVPQLRQKAIGDYPAAGSLEAFTPIGAGEKKHGRIVTVVAVKTSVDVTGWDALDAAGWQALIDAEDIHVIGPVTGNVPDPSETTSPGDGHQEEISDGELYDIPFHHFDPDTNMALAQKLNKQSGQGTWSVMVVFYDLSAWFWTTEGPVLVPVKYRLRGFSQGEEINQNRKMNGNIKFRVQSLPQTLSDLPKSIFKKN